jgi:hypothetical protein
MRAPLISDYHRQWRQNLKLGLEIVGRGKGWSDIEGGWGEGQIQWCEAAGLKKSKEESKEGNGGGWGREGEEVSTQQAPSTRAMDALIT